MAPKFKSGKELEAAAGPYIWKASIYEGDSYKSIERGLEVLGKLKNTIDNLYSLLCDDEMKETNELTLDVLFNSLEGIENRIFDVKEFPDDLMKSIPPRKSLVTELYKKACESLKAGNAEEASELEKKAKAYEVNIAMLEKAASYYTRKKL